MSDTAQKPSFCPEIDRACMGWFGGECQLENSLKKTRFLHSTLQTPMGDVPLLRRLVSDNERIVLQSYNDTAKILVGVVATAGTEFTIDQCSAVTNAARVFEISPIGQAAVVVPVPRMNSLPVSVSGGENDRDDTGQTGPPLVTSNIFTLPPTSPVPVTFRPAFSDNPAV